MCPECGAVLPVDPRYSPWCAACGWNADPSPPTAAAPSRWAARRAARAAHAAFRAHDRAVLAGAARRPLLRPLAWVAAAPVYALTGLLVVAAVRVPGLNAYPAWKVLCAAVILGLLWFVVPRPYPVPAGADALTATDARSAFAVLAAVADAVGAKTPAILVVSDDDGTWSGRAGVRRHRVLGLGLGLWNVLDHRGRLALLAHHLADDVSGDVRGDPVVAVGVRMLDRWEQVLHPGSTRSSAALLHGGADVAVVEFQAAARYAEVFARVVLAGGWAVVRAAGWGLARIVRGDVVRAEYRADVAAARAAGRDAVVGMLRTTLVARQAEQALMTATNRRDADVWAGQRELFGRLPAQEVDRAEHVARARSAQVDAYHPPTHLRLDHLRALPDHGATVHVDAALLRAMDAEVFPALERARRRLR